jgi:two-component system, LuxR family, sensor kinase FixL
MKLLDSQMIIGLLSIVLAVAIFMFDLIMPLGVAVGLLYVAVIVLSLWSPWKEYIYWVAIIITTFIVIGFYLSQDAVIYWIVMTNRGMSIAGVWGTAFLVTQIVKKEVSERGIVETVPDGIITINELGIIQSFNPAAETIFSYTAAELIGKNISTLMPSPYREEHGQYLQNYLATGEKKIIGFGREVQGMRKDGSFFPMSLAVNEIYKDKNKHFIGVVRDISKFKKTEENLRSEHEFNEKLIQTAKVIILILNPDSSINQFNKYMEELSGYSLEEVQGQDWVTVFIPEKEQASISQLFKNSFTEAKQGNVNAIITKDGHSRMVEWYNSPITDAKGEITGLLSIGHDITEHTRTHDQLVTRTQQLEVLSELEQMVLSGSQLSSLIENAVKAMVSTLGMDYGNLLELLPDKKHFKIHMETGRVDSFTETATIPLERDVLAKQTLNTKEPVIIDNMQADPSFSETSFLNEHGLRSAMCVQISNPNQTMGVLCVYKKKQHNFTDDEINFLQSIANILAVAIERSQGEVRLRNLQQELIYTSRSSAIGELGTAITHELNQPITALMNYIQSCQRLLYKKYHQIPQDIAALIDKTINESERAASIIHHLRDYIQSGTLYQGKEDLNSLVQETYELIRNEASEKNIKVTCDFQPGLGQAYVDKIQIQQVIFNLLRNSMDALDQVVSREIHIVTTEYDDDMLEVIVEDTGPGVRPDILNLEFKKAYSTKEDGLGIGLSICRTIIEAHGGKLWCSTSAIGGAVFHFTIPVE